MTDLRSALAAALSRAAAVPGVRVEVAGCGFGVRVWPDGSVESDLVVPAALGAVPSFRVAAVGGPGLRVAAERLERALVGEARLLRALDLPAISPAASEVVSNV